MIDIFYSQKGTPYVMASDLHKALEIGTKLSVWFPRMIEYGFDEKKDFVQQSKNVTLVQGGYNVKKDWALTLEMAKHVAMIQRSPLGKQIRDYLLNLDKRVNEGEFLNHAQIMALFDICKVMGYFSVQKYFEKEHYDKVFKTPGFNWWQERANLFGYSAEQLQEALREIGVRYKNHRQAILRIEKHELIRIGVVDLFLAMGKSKGYAKNLGNIAKDIALQINPEIYNDLDTTIDFKSEEQLKIITDLKNYKVNSERLSKFNKTPAKAIDKKQLNFGNMLGGVARAGKPEKEK